MDSRQSRFHFEHYYIESPRQYGDILLYQIGDRLCQGGIEVAPHRQVCHEISCIISGTGSFYADQRRFLVRPGDLFISPLGVVHQILSSVQEPLRYSYCGFMLDPRSHGELLEFFGNVQAPLAVDRHSSVRQAFSLLINELIINDASTELLVENQLDQLLLLTRRCYERNTPRHRDPLQGDGLRQRMVCDVIDYIDAHIFGIRKLTDISEQMGYSYSYVSQSFAAVTGCSLNRYYQNRRFEKAVELLGRASTVTQVSEDLGFDSVQSFSRFFRKNCGAPPSRYIRSGDGS